MIELSKTSQGVLLRVKTYPGGRVNAIRGERDGALKVVVTQVPEKGKANQALIALLSNQLGLRKSQFALVSGATSRQKTLLITGVEPRELNARIATALAEPG